MNSHEEILCDCELYKFHLRKFVFGCVESVGELWDIPVG